MHVAIRFSFLALTLVGSCVSVSTLSAQQMPPSSGFSVQASLWPGPELPIGKLQDIVLDATIRNDSAQNGTWHGFSQNSVGYGEVRMLGNSAVAVCETPHDDREVSEPPRSFAPGTSTSVVFGFASIACPSFQPGQVQYEVRFCVNPHIFQPWTGDVCSAWTSVTLDPLGAMLRRDDTALRQQIERMRASGEPSDQKLALDALEARSRPVQTSLEEPASSHAGMAEEQLTTLWLEFIRAEGKVIATLAPTIGTVVTHVDPPMGCTWIHGDNDPCPYDHVLSAQYRKDVAENERRRIALNRLAEFRNTAQLSISYFGVRMGALYRRNPAAREALYTQAQTMGLDEHQLSELHRFVEFSSH